MGLRFGTCSDSSHRDGADRCCKVSVAASLPLGRGRRAWGCLTDWSVVSGVYPVMRKCSRGVGISEAISPMRSLFMYPGYLSVVVLADMMVET